MPNPSTINIGKVQIALHEYAEKEVRTDDSLRTERARTAQLAEHLCAIGAEILIRLAREHDRDPLDLLDEIEMSEWAE